MSAARAIAPSICIACRGPRGALDERPRARGVPGCRAAREHLGRVERRLDHHRRRAHPLGGGARGLEVPERALGLAERHREQAEVARDRPQVRRADRDHVAALVRGELVVQQPRPLAIVEDDAELAEQRHREQPAGVAREVLEVVRGELVELLARLVDAAVLREHEHEHQPPAPHEHEALGVAAQERDVAAMAALGAADEEHLAVGDELRHRAARAPAPGRRPRGRGARLPRTGPASSPGTRETAARRRACAAGRAGSRSGCRPRSRRRRGRDRRARAAG